jgi:uncharacterized membrane protein YhaH (DUF805 family)
MGTEWYVARGGETFGPFAFDVVADAARSGELRKDDLVWRAGMETWAGASTVPDLWTPPAMPSREAAPAPVEGVVKRAARRSAITLKQLILPSGRTNRRSFWGFLLSAYLAGVAALNALHLLWPAGAQRAIGVMGFLAFCVLISATIGRLHDHDRTGWYAVVYAFPAAMLVWARIELDLQQTLLRAGSALALLSVLAMIIHIGVLRGTIGPNRFGPDPAGTEHPDDFYTQSRFINLFAPPWMPVFTVAGRAWVAVRLLMSKMGAHELAAAMKGAEEKHEEGVRRNIALAEQKGWQQVLRWHGMKVVDPHLHTFSWLSEVITAIVVVPSLSVLLAFWLLAALSFVAPEVVSMLGSDWGQASLSLSGILLIIMAPILISVRIRKARNQATAIAAPA